MSGSFPPRVGDRIANRYKLTAFVRGDGPAQVFRAQDAQGGGVVLVVFDPARCEPDTWASFAQLIEVTTAAALPGLSLLQGVSETPPSPPHCLAEVDLGRSFDSLRAEEGRLPWQRALSLGEQAAAILEEVEATIGLPHRALTGARCSVGAQGQVKLLDYGIAELEPIEGRADELGYRAPEQQKGPGDAASDVFSLAVILFEMIAGERPSPKQARSLRSLVPEVPPAVDELLAQALAVEPEARPPNAAALRASLREVLGIDPAPGLPGASPTLESAASEKPTAAGPAKPAIAPSAPPTLTIGGSSQALPAPPAGASSVRSLAAGLAPLEEPRTSGLFERLRGPSAPLAGPPRSEPLPSTVRGAAALRMSEVPAARMASGPSAAASASGRIDRTELLPEANATPAGRSDRTEIFVEDKSQPVARTEIFVENKSPPAARSDRTEIFVENKSQPAARTEIFVENKSAPAARTEIFVDSKPAARSDGGAAPVRNDRTEIFMGNSGQSGARTEIFMGNSGQSGARNDRTELLPPSVSFTAGQPQPDRERSLAPAAAPPARSGPPSPSAAPAPEKAARSPVKVALIVVNTVLLLLVALVLALR
ncbi:serine/threonine protein kinase [Nannocystis bainbridge]|uniref:Protein kinase domain-containing protein n=1 Tax=Nannocystis bainbridge TaxID=2995303 RepID=A0ABT5DVP0_9BACT|nr:protein kinase [Nannocystis bainbridge]MDC0716778.1 hypothetical protein [Nannocystis bainbridge]